MIDFTVLENAIKDVIKENGNREITGDILQQTLLAMLNSIKAQANQEFTDVRGNYVPLAKDVDEDSAARANGIYVPWQDYLYAIARPDDPSTLGVRGEFRNYEPNWLLSSMPALFLDAGEIFVFEQGESIDIQDFLNTGGTDNKFYSLGEDSNYERLRRYLEIGQLLICKISNSIYYYRIENTIKVGDVYRLRCGDAAHWSPEGELSSGNAWLFEFDFTNNNNTVKYWYEEV